MTDMTFETHGVLHTLLNNRDVISSRNDSLIPKSLQTTEIEIISNLLIRQLIKWVIIQIRIVRLTSTWLNLGMNWSEPRFKNDITRAKNDIKLGSRKVEIRGAHSERTFSKKLKEIFEERKF